VTLIVTLALDDLSPRTFNGLRTEYFPPSRLVVGAHVSLVHAIPDALEHTLLQHVQRGCTAQAPFILAVKRLRFLGRGVAYDLVSADAVRLRAILREIAAAALTAHDAAPWSPHITIQNRVIPQFARATMQTLGTIELTCPITAVGIAVWRYLGGPWPPVAAFDVTAKPLAA
jgi:hypothetical protein